MKATGIVRRIDDLGRIVIPKEIRRTLRIREADPLEIFTDREGEIILKKYSPIGEMTTFARQYAESLAQVSGHTVLIADRDQFIAAAGGCRNLIGKPLSREMEQQIESRQIVLATRGDRTFVQIAPEGVEECDWRGGFAGAEQNARYGGSGTKADSVCVRISWAADGAMRRNPPHRCDFITDAAGFRIGRYSRIFRHATYISCRGVKWLHKI